MRILNSGKTIDELTRYSIDSNVIITHIKNSSTPPNWRFWVLWGVQFALSLSVSSFCVSLSREEGRKFTWHHFPLIVLLESHRDRAEPIFLVEYPCGIAATA